MLALLGRNLEPNLNIFEVDLDYMLQLLRIDGCKMMTKRKL